MQALYAFFQSHKSDLPVAEREMFRSIDKVYELYLYLLLLLQELGEADKTNADELQQKFFPSAMEMKAKLRIHQLSFLKALSEDRDFALQVKRFGSSWQKDNDLVRKIFLEIKKSEEYQEFLAADEPQEAEFIISIFKKYILSSEALRHHIEEENIFWSDEFDFIGQIITRSIKSFYTSGKFEILPLYKDEEDDRAFAHTLFAQTILNNKEYEADISERTKNWEVDRIALMDILILKMALAELVHFPGIPVKVSINEYIDISKEYSTPKSKQFVNGIIDKLAIDYKEKGKIVKSGRGLIG